MSSVESKGGMARKIAALAAGALAAKFAMMAVELLWTKGLKRDLPEMSDEESIALKIAWIGLTAASVGMARELARELTAPKVAEEGD
ncbi:MAG TPA: hypothetical protein VND22_01730 [Actinomycetota bacterium]|nr:hypothetical protein [Actinomycetota bacterium]